MDMNPADVRVALLRANISQAKLAHDLNVDPSLISKVIDGYSVSHRVRSAIADAINVDIRMIWPSTYIMHGGPRKAGRPKSFEDHKKPSTLSY